MGIQKITFVGDIMCEPLIMKAAKRNGEYCFDSVFRNITELFSESDYVIGNLETPLAGKEAVYTKELMKFNAPDSFADAVKKAGVQLVLTGNNHCLDRGIPGLERTLQVLDQKGLLHTGTFAKDGARNEAAYFTLGDTRYAVISYTYATNYYANKLLLGEDETHMVNLLRPQQAKGHSYPAVKRTFKQRVVGRILRSFTEEQGFYIKKALGMPVYVPHEDDLVDEEASRPYVEQFQRDIRLAKEKADVVFFCPHVGGQFNIKPGAFSKYIFQKAAEAGCDAIIGHHAHVVQEYCEVEGIPSFFSLGNFSMSPNSIYLVMENLPEYGLAVHVYCKDGKLDRCTFSILKILEGKEPLTVMPVDMLYQKLREAGEREKLERDVRAIYERVTGRKNDSLQIEGEYQL